MKSFRVHFVNCIPAFLLILPALAGCTSARIPGNPHLEAIDAIRAALELPASPLEFIENTFMANSPTGGLQVAVYQDADGRKYSVDPGSNRVVEIDARQLLDSIPSNALLLSEEELKAKAWKYARATIPDFEALQTNWSYEAGSKGDNYFYTWYENIQPGSMNRRFAQIALHKSGLLFAYYNTLLIDK